VSLRGLVGRRFLSGVCVLASAVAVAACSSSTKSPSASSPTRGPSGSSASSAQAASGAPIKVGVICTCSAGGGFGAVLQPGEEVYKAWANNVNAAGGIDGHAVQVITEDDQGNPGTALSAAQTLISDHVVAVADISLADQAFASTLQSANIPAVGVLTYEAPFFSNPDFYPEGQTTDSSAYAVAATAKAAGATSFGFIYCAEAAICAQSVPTFESAGKQLGLPLSYTAAVSATAPNYTAQCLAAKQKGINALGIGEAAPILIRIATDCTRQGYNPIYVFEGAGFAMDETTSPGLKDKSYDESLSLPFFANTPAANAAKAAIDKYYPGLLENPTGFTEQNYVSWASGLLLEDAIKAGGLTASSTPSASEVISGLQSLKGDTLQGMAPPLTFAAGKAHSVDCWFTIRVQNGTATVANNNQVTCKNGTSSS
jgi:branched-chain amino acid transport system substrate-binding protein